FRQCLDTTVVGEASTVERHLLDAGGLRLFGDALADSGCSGGVATVLELLADFLLGRRGRGDDAGAVDGNHAGVDVQVRAEDRQTSDILLGDTGPRLTRAAQPLFFLVQHGVAPYFFFVSFRPTRSSA